MRLAATLLLCASWLSAALVRGDSIDTGFSQDGATTYCQGIKAGQSNMKFAELRPSNAGRCPILVSMTAKAAAVHVNEPVVISWHAQAKSGEIPNNIFPNAIDAASKKAKPVLTSFIKACLAGTNCATPIDGGITGPASVSATGDFGGDGKKDLREYTFTFPKPGDYVLVGIVELGGDSTLNVSASDFIAFLKISVVAAGAPLPATNTTTAPPNNNNNSNANANNSTTSDKNASSNSTTAPPKTEAPTSLPVNGPGHVSPANASHSSSSEAGVVSNDPTPPKEGSSAGGSGANAAKNASSMGFLKQHTALLATAGGLCAIVLVVGYVTLMGRRTSRKAQYHKEMLRVYSARRGSTDEESNLEYARKHSTRSKSMRRPSPSAKNDPNAVAILSPPSSLSDDMDGDDFIKRGSEFEHTQRNVRGKSTGLSSIAESSQAASMSSQAILYNPSDASLGAIRSTTSSEMVAESADDLEKDYFEPPSWHESELASENGDQHVSCVSFDSDLSVEDDNVKMSSFASHDLSLFDSERSINVPSFASGPSTARRFTNESYDSEMSAPSPRTYSEASVDSYAFRPSDNSNNESRYSGFSMLSEDELNRSRGASSAKNARRK